MTKVKVVISSNDVRAVNQRLFKSNRSTDSCTCGESRRVPEVSCDKERIDSSWRSVMEENG
jgi:hypothetical protein